MSSDRAEFIGAKLGQFALPDLSGRRWTAADLAGRNAVLFCFATW